MSQTDQIEPAGSISSQDPHNEQKKKTKSRRPPSEPPAALLLSEQTVLMDNQILRSDSND